MRQDGSQHVVLIEREAARRFRDPIRAGEIAERVGLHPAYAAVLFRKHRGITITDYITSLRVRHAEALIKAQPQRSVLDIALDSGFGSVSRFYEAFRRVTGRAPRQALPSSALVLSPPTLRFALWIDDQPQNNVRERRALAHRGVFADTCRTNAEGEAALESAEYDLILSDVSRAQQGEQGWDFAQIAARKASHAPIIFYCGYIDQSRRQTARRVGAVAICDQPDALLAASIGSLSP